MIFKYLKTRLFNFNFFPLQKVLLSFILLIFSGSILLMLPTSTNNGISYIDALFTATSAVCVTGLIILDTAKDFTFSGKFIIFILIQFGGIGIMTFYLGLISLFGKNLSVKWKMTLQETYSDTGKLHVKKILIRVIKYTLFFESITALILFSQFIKDFSILKAAEHSVFLAVSAFCNAGFSTFSDSLMHYQVNYIINFAITGAIITGGLGFIVLKEISSLRFKIGKKRTDHNFFSLHTKIVLITTGILLLSGTVIFFFLEKNNSLNNFNIAQSLLVSFFQSVSCRTAGFNTINISSLRESTLLLMIGLMFIGGSPGSIAGGIKTTTIALIFLYLYSKFKNRNEVSLFGRSLSHDILDRSKILFILAVILITLISFLILVTNDFNKPFTLTSVVFETVSAFGTVGLSTGITGLLTTAGKIFIIVLMFMGRLGLLTFILNMNSRKKQYTIEYPNEQIMIG
ncbi:MAG: hypothetical protein JW982_02550 [Spirochaetes bacterium]|nr:hypothetical protein [Spirochaetota bacterium]